jgi:hypothetical protein
MQGAATAPLTFMADISKMNSVRTGSLEASYNHQDTILKWSTLAILSSPRNATVLSHASTLRNLMKHRSINFSISKFYVELIEYSVFISTGNLPKLGTECLLSYN